MLAKDSRDPFSGRELGLKATMNETGTLTVKAETAMESFALKQWAAGYFSDSEKKDGGITLQIETIETDSSGEGQ